MIAFWFSDGGDRIAVKSKPPLTVGNAEEVLEDGKLPTDGSGCHMPKALIPISCKA